MREAAAPPAPLEQALGHLAALAALLPQVLPQLRAQRAELLAEVRVVVREELAREAGAQRAREVLELPEQLNIGQAAELLGRKVSYLRKHLQEPALGACLIPSGRRRGRGADLIFDRRGPPAEAGSRAVKATLHRHQLVSARACASGLAVFDRLAKGLALTWERGGAQERSFREEYSIFWEWLEGKGLIVDPVAPGVCPRCMGRASMHTFCAYCESSGKVPLAEDYVEAVRSMFGPHLSAAECLGMLRDQAQRRAA